MSWAKASRLAKRRKKSKKEVLVVVEAVFISVGFLISKK